MLKPQQKFKYSLSINTERLSETVTIIDKLFNWSFLVNIAFNRDGRSNNAFYWDGIVYEFAEFSKEYPYLIFSVECKNITGGDSYMFYFKDGLYQMADGKVVYDEFDEDFLVEPSEL